MNTLKVYTLLHETENGSTVGVYFGMQEALDDFANILREVENDNYGLDEEEIQALVKEIAEPDYCVKLETGGNLYSVEEFLIGHHEMVIPDGFALVKEEPHSGLKQSFTVSRETMREVLYHMGLWRLSDKELAAVKKALVGDELIRPSAALETPEELAKLDAVLSTLEINQPEQEEPPLDIWATTAKILSIRHVMAGVEPMAIITLDEDFAGSREHDGYDQIGIFPKMWREKKYFIEAAHDKGDKVQICCQKKPELDRQHWVATAIEPEAPIQESFGDTEIHERTPLWQYKNEVYLYRAGEDYEVIITGDDSVGLPDDKHMLHDLDEIKAILLEVGFTEEHLHDFPQADSPEDIARWRKFDDDFITSEDGGCDNCGQKGAPDFCLNCIVCINCCTCGNKERLGYE